MMRDLLSFLRDSAHKLFSNIGAAGDHMRYGQIKGHSVNTGDNAWAADQVVYNLGGKFVYMNDGALTLCLDGQAYIYGWAKEKQRTPTAGDTCAVNVALDAVYRIPVNSGTFAIGMLGDLCDISIDTYQGAQLDASSENLLIIVGGDLVNNTWVDVKINPAVQGAAVGADD